MTKAKRAARHEQTAREFKLWLEKNPNANHKRIFYQFNVIADLVYEASKTKPVKAIPKKVMSRV